MISGLIKTAILLLLLACCEPLLHNVIFSSTPHLTLEEWSKNVAHNIESGLANACIYGKKYFYQGIYQAQELYQTISAHQSTRQHEKSKIYKTRKT
jgi:hypothetical protein